MALRWVEGFEGFDSSGTRTALDPNYDFSAQIATSDAGLRTPGRSGGRCAFVQNNTGTQHNQGMLIPLAGLSTDSTWIFGMGYQFAATEFNSSSSDRSIILQLHDGDNQPFFTVYARAGTLTVRSGGTGGTKLGVASISLVARVWWFIEIKATLHASTGSVVIRVHEQEVLNLTNVNTDPNGSTNPAQALVATGDSLVPAAGDGRGEVDDLYICDGVDGTTIGQRAAFNDFLGDNIVVRLTPNANGTTNNFTNNRTPTPDSVDNYLFVDDDPPDGDTTYVESATVGHKDLYGFQALSVTPAAIEAVVVKSYARKTDGGSRTFVHVARSSGTEEDSAAIAPSTQYQFHQSIFTADPNTSAAWGKSGVDAAEFGLKVES